MTTSTGTASDGAPAGAHDGGDDGAAAPRTQRAPRRRWVWPLVTMVAVLLVPVAAVAGARFDDVRSGQTHEEAIGWVADAGVTQGCDPAGDNYCPEDAVTRAQMASFMRRLAGHDPAVAPSVNAQTLDGRGVADLIAATRPKRTTGAVTTGDNITMAETNTATFVRTLGTFTKDRSDSRLDVTFTTHVQGTGPSWAPCRWQLRIDGRNANDVASTTGGLRNDGHELHAAVSSSVTPLTFNVHFPAVGAGTHELELWVETAGAETCFHNPGNFRRVWHVVEQ